MAQQRAQWTARSRRKIRGDGRGHQARQVGVGLRRQADPTGRRGGHRRGTAGPSCVLAQQLRTARQAVDDRRRCRIVRRGRRRRHGRARCRRRCSGWLLAEQSRRIWKFHPGPPMQRFPTFATTAAIGMRQRRMCARGGTIGPRQTYAVWIRWMALRCHFVSQEAAWQAIRKLFVCLEQGLQGYACAMPCFPRTAEKTTAFSKQRLPNGRPAAWRHCMHARQRAWAAAKRAMNPPVFSGCARGDGYRPRTQPAWVACRKRWACRGRLGKAWRTIRHITWPNWRGSEPVL